MKSTVVPVKNVDVAHDLAKENARLSQDVIRMAIDLEDHKRNETRAARGKWSSGKPGKLTGFKSSKDLHLKSALHTQEISLHGSVIGDSLNATALHPDREYADPLETVEEENMGSENYKALPMKERLSKMKQTLQHREAIAINDADLDALSVSKPALDSPVKRTSLRAQDARLQKLKKEYKLVKDEEKKSLIDYEKEREEQKAQTTASVVNLHVPDQPTGSEVNAPHVSRSRKGGSIVGSNAAKSQKGINAIPANDEANSHVMLPPHGSALYGNTASNSDYLQKQRRKKRTAHNSPVKRPPRVNDEEDSLIISSTKDKPETTGAVAPKMFPIKESTKYNYDAALNDWLQTLNLKDVERVKDIFFSNNISLIKMPIITHKDLTRFGFKQSDPDFVKILRGLIELKEDCAKHPEKYKLNMQRSKERESKQVGKPTAGSRRLSSEPEKGAKGSSSYGESSEGLLPPIAGSQGHSQSEGVDVPTSQHVLLERVGSGSLINHAVELQQIEEYETSGVSSLIFSVTETDKNEVQSLLMSEDVTGAMPSGRDPKLSQSHEFASKDLDRDWMEESTQLSESRTMEDVDDKDSSRKISNATTSAAFVPLYNKDPAKLSKVLSSDLARKDALTAVEQATKKWEKKQKEQEQQQEKAEGVKAERQERRDRLAARHHHKTSITAANAATTSSNSTSIPSKGGNKQKQQTGAGSSTGVGRGTLEGENTSSSPERAAVANQLITAEVGSVAGDTDFELVGAKIKPLMTTRGMMQNNLYSKQSTSIQAGASLHQSGVVSNPTSKKKYPPDPLPTADIDKENGGLVLEGKAVINSPRIEPSKLNTQRTVRADILKSEPLVEFQMSEGTDSRSKTFDKEFSSIKHDLEQALNQLEGTPRLEEKPLKEEPFGTLEEAVKMRKTSSDQLSALAKERETMKINAVTETAPSVEGTSETTESDKGAQTPVAREDSGTISPSLVVSEKSLNMHDGNRESSEYSGGNKSTVSTNSTHDLLQQLDMKLQVLKHSGSTPETLSMIEKIKVQLAQFELGMPGTGSTRVLSDYPTFARRNRARTVASAKMSQHKHTPVRELLMPGHDLPGQAKSSSKAKTLMSLKASMAEQDMVKSLQKQQTQYKQQIRHLERELKRLKEHDPLSACELNIEDLQFSEEDFIGDGAFADVFWGYYSGSEVAIKRLKGLLSSSDESYFNAEVALLRELRHPNVVLLLGVCRDAEQRPLMVLEYMANGSLFDVLHDFERPGLDHVAFYQISKDMAVGMNYLHRHKPGPVLHLDLKSMNVLLDGYGRAKIGDFGFSKLKSSTESGTEKQLSVESRKGSPAWMAPETLQQGKVSTKSDVYSFGVILWEMLTREKPYEGMGLFHVLEGVTKGLRPIIPGWVPEELQTLINSCWHPQPAQRPSFQDVLDILDNLHLPMEWKSLLDAAGVPRIALEDPEVTRSIVEFVHLSLNVSDSSSSVPTSGGGLSESLLHEERQMIDLEVVSAFEMLTRKQKEKSYQSLVPALTNLSGSVSEKSSLLNSQMKDIESLLDKSSTNVTPRASSQMQPQRNVNENGANEQTNLFTHESRPRTVIGTGGEPIRPQISDSVLQLQKSKLRPTTVAPHPSQLANLASVDEGRLSSIAAVIKQALNERREYMLEDTRDVDFDAGETSTIGANSSRSGIELD